MTCCGFAGDRPEIKEAGKVVSYHQEEAMPQTYDAGIFKQD